MELIIKDKLLPLFFFIGSSIFLYTLSFLRWEVGTDWQNYQIYFETLLNRHSENDSFELGFRWINYLARILSDNYTVSLFFSGTILFLFQSLAIFRLSPFPMTSLTFLYSVQLANILFVRQWIAIAILFYSVRYIQKNKFFRFALLVILATMLHRTALIFIVAWWIYHKDISLKTMWIFLISSILLSYVVKNFLNSLLGSFGGAVIQHKLEKYLSESYNEGINEQLNYTLILVKGVANKLLVFVLSAYVYSKAKYKQPFFKGLLNIYWFGCVIYFVMLPISLALVRFSFAFDIIQVVLMSYVFYSFKDIWNRIILFTIFIVYLGLRLFTFLNSAYHEELVPYKSIFS